MTKSRTPETSDNESQNRPQHRWIAVTSGLLATLFLQGILIGITYLTFFVIDDTYRIYAYIALIVFSAFVIISAYRNASRHAIGKFDKIINSCHQKLINLISPNARHSMNSEDYEQFVRHKLQKFRFYAPIHISITTTLNVAISTVFLIFVFSVAALATYDFFRGDRLDLTVQAMISLDSILKGVALDIMESFNLSIHSQKSLDVFQQTISFITRTAVSLGLIGALVPLILKIIDERRLAKLISKPDDKIRFFGFIDGKVRSSLSELPEAEHRSGELIRVYEQIVFPAIWKNNGVGLKIAYDELFNVFKVGRATNWWEGAGSINKRAEQHLSSKKSPEELLAMSKRVKDCVKTDMFIVNPSASIFILIQPGFQSIDSFEYDTEQREFYYIFKGGYKLPLENKIGDNMHTTLKNRVELHLIEMGDQEHPTAYSIKPLTLA